MIPIASTTVAILRAPVLAGDTDGFPDTAPSWQTQATAIRAIISSPGGSSVRNGSLQTTTDFHLSADPCDLRHTDRVLDERTEAVYEVQWVAARTGYGLDHVEAGLRRVEGFGQ